MAVRNFFVDAIIDGRKTEIGSGPRAKNGGMIVNIYQRKDGSIDDALSIYCYAHHDGTLLLRATHHGKTVCEYETKR